MRIYTVVLATALAAILLVTTLSSPLVAASSGPDANTGDPKDSDPQRRHKFKFWRKKNSNGSGSGPVDSFSKALCRPPTIQGDSPAIAGLESYAAAYHQVYAFTKDLFRGHQVMIKKKVADEIVEESMTYDGVVQQLDGLLENIAIQRENVKSEAPANIRCVKDLSARLTRRIRWLRQKVLIAIAWRDFAAARKNAASKTSKFFQGVMQLPKKWAQPKSGF